MLKLFFGFILLPLAVGSVIYHLNNSGFFNVAHINIDFEMEVAAGQKEFLNPLVADLEKKMSIYKGTSLWKLPLQKISKDLEAFNWIENSSIKRSWPNTLTFRINPYRVKLLYMGKYGKLLPIIKNGEFLDAIETRQAPDVALLEGEVFVKKPELRKKAVAIMEDVPDEGSFSRKTISEVRFDDKDGFWMTLMKSGIQVKIGDDKVALKAARVSRVVDYLDSRQFDARVIDANLSKKVLVRLRKDP